MSGSAGGTLYQLRNLINRRNVVKDPSKDFKACEDFFLLAVKAHILCAAMQEFGMEELDSSIPDTLCKDKKTSIEAVATKIVDKFTDISFPPSKDKKTVDSVQEYAKEVMTMGCYYLEFQDAIREGDGKRVLMFWKFFLPLCRSTRHHNYANEALNMIAQYNYLLPPCLAEQLLQSRFVNTRGLPGHNIAADLHLEHLNRLCKDAIKNLGANKSGKAFVRIGKSAQVLHDILGNFNESAGVSVDSGAHTHRSNVEDLKKITKALKDARVLTKEQEPRHHNSFEGFCCNLFKKIDQKTFELWIHQRFAAFTNGCQI